MLCPLVFSRSNIAANLNDQAMQLGVGADEFIAPFDGYIAAISVVSNAALGGGSFAVNPVIDGTQADDQVIIETGELRDTKYYNPRAITVNKGQRVGCAFDTSAAFTPTTADISVVVWYMAVRNDPPAQYWTG